MKKRTMSFFLCLVMVISVFVAAFPAAVASEAEDSVLILTDGEAVSEIDLPKEEKITLTAAYAGEGDYQWQILLNASGDQWVDIYDKTAADCEVSYALVKNMLSSADRAYLRCAVTGDAVLYSEPVCVNVLPASESDAAETAESAPLAPAPLPAPEAEVIVSAPAEETAEDVEAFLAAAEATAFTLFANGADTGDDTTTTYYTVTIEYVYGKDSKFDGQRVALPYIYEAVANQLLDGKVTSPECVGYTPDTSVFDLSILGTITGNVTQYVYYNPAEVSYTVRHYQQNVDDDEYTWVDTTLAAGYTEDLTSDNAAKSYTGFTALSHYHEEIAADSSTTIDIYYDRNYYLMSFDLQGGYGVDPIYARYGTPISVPAPQREGWTFAGWDATIPSTMPAEDTKFTASWTAKSGISFTVAYWLEDANTDGKYNFWGSKTQTGTAGTTVNGETYKDYTQYLDTDNPDGNDDTNDAMDTYEMRYSTYSHADKDVVIKGDGSTVVNVYYNRNEYTLKFYYAMEDTTSSKYYVIGGSTYRFGASATIDDTGNEVALLDHYMSDSYNSQRGAVDELPTLNAIGTARNYTSGADESTVTTGNVWNTYKYHYISFSAKYGEDISGMWPCNVFNSVTRTDKDSTNNWSGTEAFVSAWNGEHHVYYSQEEGKDTVYGNQTIKGNYNELDYQLLWDYDNFGDSDTVAYLCFWENGANIGWSIPELYRYQIWVPTLEGQDTTGLTTKIYDDKTYYLWATYDTCDNSSYDKQTAPAINGYTLVAGPVEGNTLTDYDEALYAEAYNVDFYYSRDQYTLTFRNGNTTAKTESVYFGADISGMAPDVTYYDKELADVYEIDGWYTSPDALAGSKYDLTGATMPSSNLLLYAGWKKVTHSVSVYLTEGGNKIGETQIVTHDEFAEAPDTSKLKHPTDSSATFIGWFYKENGVEKAFSFDSTPITADMTIYAKWRSNVMKQVEISYVCVDENGDKIAQIADTETLMMRLGQTRTFDAKTGNSLYADYRAGYFPTTASHSITITDTDIESNDPVTYTFAYKKYGTVPYQVEFYVEEADGTLRPAFKTVTETVDGKEATKAEFVEYGQWNDTYTGYVEQHWQNDKAVVVELYVPDDLADTAWTLPDAYLPNQLKIQKVIVPSTTNPETNIEANVIQFIYTYTKEVTDPDPEDPNNPGKVYESKYLVQHYVQNVNSTDTYDLYSWQTLTGYSTHTATASPITIPGYTYSYAVTEAKKQTGTTLAAGTDGATNTMDDTLSGTISAKDDLELNFYYNANSYPYRVLYLEEGTNRELAAAKTKDTAGNLLTGLYGAKVTESAIDLNGDAVDEYDLVGESTKSIYIQMEAGNTASVNTIVFYYKLKNADLIISKTVALDATQAEEAGIDKLPESALTQEFEFTIYCKTGFNKSFYDYTITENGKDDITGKQQTDNATTMTVKLKHGQTIRIEGLIMGTYTITETYVPGFRITVGENTDAQQKKDVSVTAELVEADKDVQVDFTNSYPFYTGELVLGKTVTKANTTDPNAKEPYKVTVVLTPADETRDEVDRVITWTDGDGTARSLTVPKLTGTNDQTVFTIDVLVPVGGTVTLNGVPAGDFTATETVKGTIGYITDYYKVWYNKDLHKNETTETAQGASVTGVIHGGHPTTVNFTNTYKKGDLTINKTVTQEYVNDNWNGDTFTFSISGTTELPDGEYTVDGAIVNVSGGDVTVKDADGNDPTISITKTEGTTSWSGSLTIANLPAGYYTVTESAGLGNDKYSASVVCEPDTGLVNDTTNPAVFTFNNIYNRTTGSLQVSKTVQIVGEGYTEDENQEFEFTVKLTDKPLTGPYTYTKGDGTPDTLTANDDGTLTFTLTHDESITIGGLPVGEYEISETPVDKYAPYFTGNETDSANAKASATVTTGSVTLVKCTNKYPVNYGTLTVKKEVVTPKGYNEIDVAPKEDEFTFTVKISDYSALVNLNGKVTARFSGYESERLLDVKDDTITFNLLAGQSVDLELPACSYTIAESGLSSEVNSDVLADHYTTTSVIGSVTGDTSISSTLVSGETETVTFTNTYKRHYANLTIDNINSPDDEQVYVYTVTGKDLSITVTVVGNGETTIHDLPVGEYTVTQQDDWSWRYGSEASDGETVTLNDNTTLPVTQTVKNSDWLDGVSKLIQNVKGG